MAQISSIIDGSKFIGCPIVIRVISGAFSDVTFQRVRLEVMVVRNGSSETRTFTFSAPCKGEENVYFDISSAFRAFAESFEYKANELSYPSYAFSAKAYDDYMKNGVVYEGASQTGSLSGSGSFYVGSLTDRERANVHSEGGGLVIGYPARWTRKPTASPEVVFSGSKILVPGTLFLNGVVTPPSAVSVDAPVGVGATYNCYGIDKPADGYEMRFINSLGVHDSIHVHCLLTSEVSIATDRHVIARQDTLMNVSHGISLKKNNHERWKMSSGPLDRAWQQWYLHEVLMARWAWVKVDNHWFRVHILPEETVKGVDRQKASMLTVEFTIEFDINGNPFNE